MRFPLPVRLAILLGVAALAGLPACKMEKAGPPPRAAADRKGLVQVTGYCNCGTCCGWERGWFGLGNPVYSYGKMRGKPKKVGYTSTGTRAHHGTIAADPALFPPGTRLYVPGYGPGVVEDVGGAIKGRHIDVWFPTHEEALRWGSRWLQVTRRP